jgi:protein O-mannosyl-transferase
LHRCSPEHGHEQYVPTALDRISPSLDAALVTAETKPRTIAVAAGLIAATVFAYTNSFSVPFVFDDVAAITQNPSLEKLSTVLSPPPGLSVTGRPLVNLSLALNYAISGRAVWSYHALNLALHLGCALALFGLIRRTVSLRWMATSGRRLGRGRSNETSFPWSRYLDRYKTRPEVAFHLDPTGIAFATALIWSLHPLQTAAVTYLMQRSELLVSLSFLVTLYAFLRAAQCHVLSDTFPSFHRDALVKCHLIGDTGTSKRRVRTVWLVVSVVACACGMAAKEVMISAPLVVLLYDRTFIAGSFRAALRTRWRYYAGLATTWIILVALIVGTDSRGGSAGFASAITWSDYATTQLYAFGHYLRLVVWPVPLIFDYGDVLIRETSLVVTGAIVVVAAVAATLFALRRYPAAGFCGVTFFALLAPTTSIVPIATQTIAEHRLHLALAVPLLLLLILGLNRLTNRCGIILATSIALALGAATFARNAMYRSPVTLWADTVAKQPANARAHYNLAISLLASGSPADTTRALAELRVTLRLEPEHASAHQKLGSLLVAADRAADALPHLETAARLQPDSAAVHNDLALALVRLRRVSQAARHFATAVRLDPRHAAARYNFGNALVELARYDEALAAFEEAARLDPGDASARNNAGRLRDYLRK